MQFVYNSALVKGINSSGVSGQYSLEGALNRLLAGSGIAYRFNNGNTVTLEKMAVVEPQSAALALAVLLLQPAWLQNLRSDYHTAAGEQRKIELTDGSTVLLNTDSAIAVELKADQRLVKLLHGEAFFQVAHASDRPFSVLAGDTQARVTGTAFSVNREQSRVAVTVREGRVETSRPEHPDPAIALTPGQSAVYAGQQPAVVQTVDTSRDLAWRQGQMVFVQAPLSEVVAQINRYRPGRLLITNPRLERRPITAVFAIDRLDDAVAALERTLGLQAKRLTGYFVLLG